MKKVKHITFAFLFSFLLTGCFGLFDSGTDTIVDDYEVTWIDLHQERALYKGEELVPAYVFAAGHNSKYIFAKQHPLLPENSKEIIDTSITNYYIIQQTKNGFQNKPVYGPLTKQRFDSLLLKLNITDVEFDLTYPTNLY
jgi:hypothetical protein